MKRNGLSIVIFVFFSTPVGSIIAAFGAQKALTYTTVTLAKIGLTKLRFRRLETDSNCDGGTDRLCSYLFFLQTR